MSGYIQMTKPYLWTALQGVRRPGLPKHLRVRYVMALHEAGRALVATLLRRRRLAEGLPPRLERVERVSVVARGRCVGGCGAVLCCAALRCAAKVVVGLAWLLYALRWKMRCLHVCRG